MLLNLSNHPYGTWQKDQYQAAEKLFGGVVDMPFPNVDPYADETEIMEMAEAYFQKIQAEYGTGIAAVHLMGELCFCFALTRLYKGSSLYHGEKSNRAGRGSENGSFPLHKV